MGKQRRRTAAVGMLTAVMLVSSAGSAFAHVCFNASKPTGAGSAGTATIDVATGEFTPGDENVNPQGRPRGGFTTMTVEAGGDYMGTFDTFAHTTLPDGALNAGPGDDQCDGVGIDNAEACLAP